MSEDNYPSPSPYDTTKRQNTTHYSELKNYPKLLNEWTGLHIKYWITYKCKLDSKYGQLLYLKGVNGTNILKINQNNLKLNGIKTIGARRTILKEMKILKGFYNS